MAGEKVIKSFGAINIGTKYMTKDSKSWCPLCQKYFDDGEETVTLNLCTHLRAYHKECIVGFTGHIIDLFGKEVL